MIQLSLSLFSLLYFFLILPMKRGVHDCARIGSLSILFYNHFLTHRFITSSIGRMTGSWASYISMEGMMECLLARSRRYSLFFVSARGPQDPASRGRHSRWAVGVPGSVFFLCGLMVIDIL